MPGKVCIASLLDQPAPFKNTLPSLGHPGPTLKAGSGNSPQQALLGQLMMDVCFCFSFTPFISTNPKRCSSSFSSCTCSYQC